MPAPSAGSGRRTAWLSTIVPPDKTDQKGVLSLWIFYTEVALTIFCILLFSNALIGPVFAPQSLDLAAVAEDSAILRLVWLPVYAVTLLLVAMRITRMMRILPALFMTGMLVGLCFASSYWSIAADVSTRRSIAVALTTLFGLYLASRYRGDQLVQIIALSFTLLTFGSYFVCIFVPSLGIHNDINAGAWKGLWYEKNQMAAIMVLGFIATCASAYIAPERRKIWIAQAVIIFALVVLSRSKTSLLACMLSALAFPPLIAVQRGGVLSILFIWFSATCALVGGTLFYVAPDLIFKLLGKDPTLTGRTEIWASLMRLSDKHPWLGYGYKAFWTPYSIPASVVRAETQWGVPSAHNGWLDLLIQLGWVGVVLFGLCLAAGYFCALFRFSSVRDGFFSVLILVLFSVLILSESFILSQNSLIWALFVCALARLTANELEA
ncbi:MAG: O-antigen ligase [Asticcacaulis sp.]